MSQVSRWQGHCRTDEAKNKGQTSYFFPIVFKIKLIGATGEGRGEEVVASGRAPAQNPLVRAWGCGLATELSPCVQEVLGSLDSTSKREVGREISVVNLSAT